ncbi:MAG: serine/threonine-protein phosphatase [Lachnospiraceae bacterium]|nr:serine/threonine-protein phosphatase [Lachnospiraceae bacterium]
MKRLDKKNKRILVGALLTYAFFTVLTLVLFIVRDAKTLPVTSVINISMDMIGMIMGCVLFVTCLIDVAKTGANYRIYMYLLNVVFTGLMTDAMAWMADGISSLRICNILINTIYYMCTSMAACLFYLFITTQMKLGEKRLLNMRRFLDLGLIITIAVILINIPFGFLFTVSEDGVYKRELLSPLSNIYGYVTMIAALVLISKEKKQLERYKIITFLLYALLPIVVSIFSTVVYGLSIGYPVTMCIMLLMYCIINVSQGRAQAANARDMEVASAIQLGVLPRIFPPFPERKEFDIYAYMDPAKEVGGDFYDFFLIDEDHLGLVIADVSGKGVPAALFMMITKALVKTRCLGGDSPAEALYKINNQLLASTSDLGMFVTVWLAVIEISSGRGVSVNAGHEHPAILRHGGSFELVEYPHSPAVCVLEDMEFAEREFEMKSGDVLFVYTDGVPEAMNHRREQFETDRMLKALNDAGDDDTKEIVESVKTALADYVADAEQFDDITMLCFKYHGGAGS